MSRIPYQIVRLAKGGQGITYYNEKVFFTAGALPGESGQAEVISEKSRFGRCRAVTCDKPSPLRNQNDACPISGQCDSCGFRHAKPEFALKLKAEALSSEIFKIAHLDPIEPSYYAVSAPTGSLDGLRQRVRLHLAWGKIGYFARDSHTIVPAVQCTVIDPVLANIVRQLNEIKPPALHFSCDLQIDLDDNRQAFLHIRPTESEISGRGSKKFTKPAVWLHQIIQSGLFKGIRFGDEHIAGDAMIRDTVSIPSHPDIHYWRRIGDFAQATGQGNAHLHQIVADFLQQTKPRAVADLFSGSGNLTFRAAQFVPEVHAFEFYCDPDAFNRGIEDNRQTWLQNTRVDMQLSDLTKGLPRTAAKCDAAICDPAREGLSEKMCHDLKTSRIRHILYISCEATNLARDLARLKDTFELRSLGFVDMFPQTPHVETVCLLSKLSEAKHHISVQVDMDELDLTAAESRATYDEIKAYVWEHAGLNVSKLYIAQTKRKCGIIERKNYNLPKSEDSRPPQCPPEKEAAIKEALKHFGMF